MRSMTVLYGRHYCRQCKQRVFPWDSQERYTEAPDRGAHGGAILLSSENSRRARHGNPDKPRRRAWCWNCYAWTETFQETLDMLLRRYRSRRGVVQRAPARSQRSNIVQLRRRKSA